VDNFKLELGHRAQLRKKATSEGFTHDWMVFVRGPETGDIQHFVDKVIFRLHDSFPKPKRVCKEPPYKVEESGYAGFLMPIEVYFKNREEPKRVCFNYDLFLNLEGNPPVNHLRCEKLTFNNPTREFRRKLVKAGGVMVPEGAESVSRPSPDYPMLPTIPLSAFSDPKKSKPSHGSKEAGGGSSKGPKLYKPAKEQRERASKASSKGEGEREREREHVKVKDDGKVAPKAAFKEPKLTLKEAKMESVSPKAGGPPEPKPPGKRPPAVESPKPSVKKQKKSSSEGPKTAPSSSPPPSSYPDKKTSKEKSRWVKVKTETPSLKESKKSPDSDESNSEDEASSKSEVRLGEARGGGALSLLLSLLSVIFPVPVRSGPLRSMVEDLRSEESDEEDTSSEEEMPVKTNPPNRDSRLEPVSDGPRPSSRSRCVTPPRLTCGLPLSVDPAPLMFGLVTPPCPWGPAHMDLFSLQAYTEELVDLHRRLMALRERSVLQQIVNLIEETGHFNVTNTTFDFDLFSLDESTVRKLQSYLEATAT
uniref:MLLT1 super elongation complex subunit n=1 Tax=Paramormyrops kingsleyae TaxID=1676925 RepID=A0A3B3T7V3_9TELE